MTTTQGGTGAGRSAPHRSRPTIVLAAVIAVLLALTGTAALSASPAAAEVVDGGTSLTLSCTASTLIGPVAADSDFSVTTHYENSISRGQTGVISVTQPATVIPTSQESGGVTATVLAINNIVARFTAPANFQVTNVATVGGSHPSTASYSAATGLVTLSIPGPIAPGATLEPPQLNITVKATGPVGTSGDLKIDSYQLTPKISASGLTMDVATSCGTPNPNPSLAHLTVATGSFVPQREAVTQSAQAFGSCTVNVGGTGGLLGEGVDLRTTVHTPQFLMNSVKDVQHGEALSITVALSPYDFVGRLNTNTKRATVLGNTFMTAPAVSVWDFSTEFQPPAGFSVQSVSTGSGMTATYNGTTNRITWARAAGVTGAIPAGPFEPAPLVINLVATGNTTNPVTYSPLTWKGMTFTARLSKAAYLLGLYVPTSVTETSRTVNCSQGGSTSGSAVNTTPANPTGTPSASLDPTPGTPYNQRIGWPTAINTWPAAINVAAFNANPKTNANVVVGTVGVANRPVAANDGPFTTDNNQPFTVHVLDNDTAGSSPFDPTKLAIVDFPEHGTATENPDGTITYNPTIGTEAPSDSFTYVAIDTAGRVSNVAAVSFGLIVRSLVQEIHVDVVGDVLTLEQAAGAVTLYEETAGGLQNLRLDGTPKDAVGVLNTVTVVDRRGTGATWDVTAQVTDFRESDADPACPSGNPASWYYRCIPGDNLGWVPLAAVGHTQVPGDVAEVHSGSAVAPAVVNAGLAAQARELCSTRSTPTRAGGTFNCGADLTLVTPASAAAQTYSATLTITLVG